MKLVPLEEITPNFSKDKVLGVMNPMKEDFEVLYGGKPQVLKSGEKKILPEPLANHIAKHLADKICRNQSNALLQEKFEGLDETGREKWKINDKIMISKNDINEVKKCLVFDAEQVVNGGVAPETKMPETRFDAPLHMEKARKQKGKKKEEEKE